MSLGSILLGGLSGLIAGIAGGPVGMAAGAAVGAGSAAAAGALKPGGQPKKQLDLSPVMKGEMPGMQFEKKPEPQSDVMDAMPGLIGAAGGALTSATKNIGSTPPLDAGAPELKAPTGQAPLPSAFGQTNQLFMSAAEKLAKQRRGY